MASTLSVSRSTETPPEYESSCQRRGNLNQAQSEEHPIDLSQNDPEKQDHVTEEPTKKAKSKIEFRIDETPPIHISVVYAFQIIFTNLPTSVLAGFILHNAVCGGKDYVFMAQMISSIIFASGVATFLQVSFGCRLPITQGSSFVFFPPILAMMESEEWRCPTAQLIANGSVADNVTLYPVGEEPWRPRVLEVSGGLIMASLVEVFLGVSGVVGLFTKFIGPLTLAPTLMLIGLTLYPFVIDACQHQWGVGFLMAALIVLLSVGLGDIRLPILTWSSKRGFHVARYPLFRMFSNLITIGICWLLCYILTVTERLPDDPEAVGYLARTDAKLEAITKSQWFYFPYPGHFGAPRFSISIFAGMLAATLSSTIESIGDYYATARMSEAPRPPIHAINRGITMEGVATVFSGLVGTCHGTTSYSNVIGFIAYTGMASRIPWLIMSVILIITGVFGKLAGALASIPEPVIGGMGLVGLGLVILVGMTQLHSVDLELTRNQMTLGLALMLGLMMPEYIKKSPEVINTGSVDVDGVIRIFLNTGPFIGGVVGLILDNILPGTKEERGMIPEKVDGSVAAEEQRCKLYDLPFCTDTLMRFRAFSFVPIFPCYGGISCPCSKPCRKKLETPINGGYKEAQEKEDVHSLTLL